VGNWLLLIGSKKSGVLHRDNRDPEKSRDTSVARIGFKSGSWAWGQMMETPKYVHISTAELKEIEAEFGRINREAFERMVGATDSNQIDVCPDVQTAHKMGWLKIRKRISAPKKRYISGRSHSTH
jgi:hypothetical protein